MLFSEPKIPQTPEADVVYQRTVPGFSALQRAENSSKTSRTCRPTAAAKFQCSSASRKFLKRRSAVETPRRWCVSVLFSEPKIPQIGGVTMFQTETPCFSALQRAENSSKTPIPEQFQYRLGFSALQRAENSSKRNDHLPHLHDHPFQCSSASRKFLKSSTSPFRPQR